MDISKYMDVRIHLLEKFRDLRLPQIDILTLLADRDSLTPREIRGTLKLPQRTAQDHTSQLVEGGFIERSNGRKPTYALTEYGRRMIYGQ